MDESSDRQGGLVIEFKAANLHCIVYNYEGVFHK